MMESVLNQCNLDDRLDHLKCGEVLTWQCAGEMYAVECKLCEDHPLCPLSEFPQHMEIWHTDWQQDLKTDNDPNEDLHQTDDDEDNDEDQFFDYEDHNDDDDHALSFTTEDSGCLFESDDHSSQNERRESDLDPINNNNEEILQPFEQVLIEQEDCVQIRKDGAEECLREVNKQVAQEVLADVTESEQDQKSNLNINKRKDKQKQPALELAETERELRYLQEITESKRELNVKETNLDEELENVKKESHKLKKSRTFLKNIKEIEEHLKELSEHETSEQEIQEKYQEFNSDNKETSENETETNKNKRISLKMLANAKNKLKTCKKTRQTKRNLNENKEINGNETEISENETSDPKNFKTINETNKSNRHVKEHLTKPRELKELIESYTETSENETETSEKETQPNENGKTKKPKRYFKENSTKSKDFKETTRKLRNSQELNENETTTSEIETETSETETSENETATSENGNETLNKTKDSKKSIKIPNSEDSFIKTPQNFTKIRKFSINLRKTLRNLQELPKTNENLNIGNEDSQEIPHTATNKRKHSENLKKFKEMEQEEMKQVELNISATNESKTVQNRTKMNKVNRIKSQNGKTRTSKRNLRPFSRDSSEMEQEERETLDLANIEENYTKSSIVPSTNSKRTRKSKSDPAKSLYEEQEFNENDFSIEEGIGDGPKRNLQNSESEIENLELRTSEDIKLTLDILNKSARKSSRTSKRRNTCNTNNLTHNEVHPSAKRTRRVSSCESIEDRTTENSPKEENKKTSKQTLVTQFFKNKNLETKTQHPSDKELRETSSKINQNSEDTSVSSTPMDVTDTRSVNSFNSSQDLGSSKDNSSPIPPEPLSPLSPNTEEEHFEFDERTKEQLNKHHISHLITLYHEHPRLWDQAHPEYCEPELCRKSWQLITDEWNEFCQRKFTIAEIRIRLGTLCQRYVQERERLALEGELDEFAKFPYYEQMQFLEQQESLQKRSELYEQQNEKILKIYQLFPLLWHINCYKLRQSKDRAEAFQNISQALKISCGLHLSSMAVQKRIRSLRKCYRLEKIRFLHAQVEQTPFKSSFCHYERMKFLHKHIEPFRCRICGRIFENLTRFREHLEEENHGNLLQEDSENEQEAEKNVKGNIVENFAKEMGDTLKSGNSEEIPVPAAVNKNLVCFSDLESSSDILQTFSPLPPSPLANEDSSTNLNLDTEPIIQEVIIFPPPTPAEPFIDCLQLENQLLEEIMENVSNDDSFTQKSLNQFINSVTSPEVMSPDSNFIEETLASDILSTGIDELPDNNIIIEETLDSDIMEAENPIDFDETQFEKDQTFKDSNSVSNTEEKSTEKLAGSQETELNKPSPLVVKVQCDDFSLDLQINSPPYEFLNPDANDSDNEVNSSGDITTLPLPDQEIHQMIALYRKYPQIWNPNHLDYNSRNLRRQAWCQLAKEFSAAVGKQFSWRTLHRKLTDYSKYYKKLITEQENYEELDNKWAFYEDFKFMDDVLVVHDELQRTVHHRDNNFKIIKIYETLPQLWDIKHPDYSKRSSKQRLIEVMCTRLQEEYNLQLTTERLKHRLIELRGQYRAAKKQRLKCERNQQSFQTDFEFYEALKFLDPHIDPFICDKCGKEFKKLTDYNLHIKREHEKLQKEKPAPLTLLPLEPGVDKNLQNICHICGLKFTNRSNLAHHVRRHEGERNYECPMCPKKFYGSHPLKVHIRSHTKECPYTCEKCGMSFVSASKLNQHVKRHLDKKDFQCDYCPKRFYTGFEKTRHERRHLNIRDKVCPVCGKTFVVGSSYYAHMMLHSDTKRFECEVCEMKFAQYAGLYKHKKKYHPT